MHLCKLTTANAGFFARNQHQRHEPLWLYMLSGWVQHYSRVLCLGTGCAPSKKEAPASCASWARLEALRALRPALGAAPSLEGGDLGVAGPLLALDGIPDVVGISTLSEGFS